MNVTEVEMGRSYRRLAELYNPNSRINMRKTKVDKKKLEYKLSLLNNAKYMYKKQNPYIQT